jgi:hypothetical protein
VFMNLLVTDAFERIRLARVSWLLINFRLN